MPIRAQAADGSIHEFPDGTKPEVVDRAMKAYAQGSRPQKAAGPSASAAALADARKRAATTPGFVRSLTQGIGYNFADNIDANLAAAETAVNSALGGALFGKKPYTPQQARQAVLQAEREAQEEYARRNPGLSTAGTVAGALVSPVNKVITPIATAARLGRFAPAVAGGVAGGIAGFGENQMEGAAPGAIAGTVAGAVLPPVFNAGMRAAAPLIQRATAAIPQRVTSAVDSGLNAAARSRAARMGAPPPPPMAAPQARAPQPKPGELKAAAALQKAIDRDLEAGVAFRPGANPLYEGGENLAGVYEAAANFPGAARQAIVRAAAQNRAQTAAGVTDDITQILGGKGDFFAYQDRLAKTQRDNAKAGMERLGDQLVTLDEDSILALRSDLARRELVKAADNMRASTDKNVRSQANDLMNVLDQVFDKPSGVTLRVRDAQTISEKLLKAGDASWRTGDGDTAQALTGLGRALRGNARDPNRGGFSEYDDWLKQYGSDADNKAALELGRDISKPSVWPEQVQNTLSEMGPGALIHYQKGVAETLMNRINAANGDVKVMRDILRDQNFASKVRVAFPDDASFAAFLASAERRVQNTERNAAFLQNSASARRAATMMDLEDQPSAMGNVLDVAMDPGNLPKKVADATLRKLPMFSPVKGALRDEQANAALARTALDPDEVTRLLNMLQAMRARQASAGRAGARATTAAAPLFIQ